MLCGRFLHTYNGGAIALKAQGCACKRLLLPAEAMERVLISHPTHAIDLKGMP
jgi:hypothetical protein